MKIILLTFGLTLVFFLVVGTIGLFALGYGVDDALPLGAQIGAAIGKAPGAVWERLSQVFGLGMAAMFIAGLMLAGWIGIARSHALGMAATGAALVLFYPVFLVADAPASWATWRMTGLYFGGWAAACVILVILFAGLTWFNNSTRR